MNGLEQMQAIAEGKARRAAIQDTLGFGLEKVAEGHAVFYSDPGPQHFNPLGTVHGGLAATLIDSATGCAVHTTLGEAEAYTTLDLTVNFVRAITADTGRVLCEGNVIHRGGRVATAEAKLIARDTGKLLAHGSATCMIFAR